MLIRAFTLIELLIVVAIIAILAAIAVPNFLEAQTRAKVSRAKADMRSLTTAMETYMVDGNAYPNCHRYGIAMRDEAGSANDPLILERLSTPIAYMNSVNVKDPFKIRFRLQSATAAQQNTEVPQSVSPATDSAAKYNTYYYQSWNNEQRYTLPPDGYSVASRSTKMKAWVLHSCGPDSIYHNLGGVLANDGASQYPAALSFLYEATNGTVSRGSLWRTGGQASSTAGYQAGVALLMATQQQN